MKSPKLRVYKAKDGWRWRLKASNGRIVAESGESYQRRRDCLKGIVRTREALIALERWVSGELQIGKKR